MPSEDVRITRSAGINFGVPNSEYRLRIDPITGEALSCHNQDTDTEYIGGGGDSDFSTAEVTITNTSGMLTNMHIPNANELSGTPFEPACIPNIPIPSGQTVVISAVLYKGRLMIPAGPDITPSGDAEISSGMIIISGDCTLTLS